MKLKKPNFEIFKNHIPNPPFYWDPKLPNSSTIARSKAPITDVIVFMVGGGSYTEYIDLIQNTANLKSIIYGCTDLINPINFLTDLQRLGKEE